MLNEFQLPSLALILSFNLGRFHHLISMAFFYLVFIIMNITFFVLIRDVDLVIPNCFILFLASAISYNK